MRALKRHVLVPVFVAAAIVSGGAAAHLATTPATSPAAHSVRTIAGPICPAGTNWDDALQMCV